jgi:aspartate 1-decarboxylase
VVDEAEVRARTPRVAHVDEANRIVEIGADPAAVVPGSGDQRPGAARAGRAVPVA